MSFYKYILAGLSVGALSLAYNLLVFQIFHLYPDYSFALPILGSSDILGLYFLIFLRGFLIGTVLMFLFAHGANALLSNKLEVKDDVKTVFFFALYGIFSLLAFTLGDFFLMKSLDGLFVLVTADSFVESMIAYLPIRLFYFGLVEE